jgi:hypothetical protein
MRQVSRLSFFAAVVLAGSVSPAHAGPYTDQLAKCLVESTTVDDRVGLVQWMFVAASAHPAVRPFSAVSEAQLEASNATMAALITRLLTQACKQEARKALRYEGTSTLEASFQVLGQVAGNELFGSPEVATALSGLEKHIDTKAFEALVAEDQ